MTAPAILQQLNGANLPNLQPIKSMMQAVRSAQNPQAMLGMMAQNNPQLKQALDIIQRSGGDPKRAYYALCEQKGINPQTILDALK